uniref:Uncharacterized protein n=1 Tax=Oryza rufipogon TaxID=4529 RepID=A0A0E0P630_ORYRU
MAAIHALHTLRRTSMAMQTSITEIAAGLDKVTELVLALRAGFEAKRAAVETTPTTPSPMPTLPKAEVQQPLATAPPSLPSSLFAATVEETVMTASSPLPLPHPAEVLQPLVAAPSSQMSFASKAAAVLPCLTTVGPALPGAPSTPSQPRETILSRHDRSLLRPRQQRGIFKQLPRASTAITLRAAQRRGESSAAPPAWDLGGPRKPHFRAAIAACAARAMWLLVAPSSLHGSGVLPLCASGWGPPELGCGRMAGTTNIILDLFFFPNNVRSPDVKGLIIGDESRCQNNHRVQTSL